MKAVILAAGKGTRMLPLTENVPKPMLPIANRPLLEHNIEYLKDAGITDFVLVVCYHKEVIKEYFKDGKKLGANIEYIEQNLANGTAGAVNAARRLINERFLVINGDILLNSVEIKKLLSTGGDTVLTARRVLNPQQYGILNVSGESVKSLTEKPEVSSSDLANAGIYIFSPSIFYFIDKTKRSIRGEYEITESIQRLIDSGGEVKFTIVESCFDIGFPWDLLEVNEIVMKGINNWNIKTENIGTLTTLKGNISVGEGTEIKNGVHIEGSVIIGNNCVIGPNCYIRPGTCIGNNVKIGSCVEIKNSIIMDNTHIAHFSYIGDSIIGRKCNFGAGTQVANLRHDGKTIRVKLGKENNKIDSGRRKLGVIMGDNVHTGINSMFNVGTVVAGGSNIIPGEYIR